MVGWPGAAGGRKIERTPARSLVIAWRASGVVGYRASAEPVSETQPWESTVTPPPRSCPGHAQQAAVAQLGAFLVQNDQTEIGASAVRPRDGIRSRREVVGAAASRDVRAPGGVDRDSVRPVVPAAADHGRP